MNQIDDVCRDVEKTINQTIQNTLNQLERDCDDIGALVDSAIDGDNAARAYNMRASGKGLLLLFLGCTLPIALAINFLSSSFSDQGGNSIAKKWLENPLEKRLENPLEIPLDYTVKNGPC